LPSLCLAAADPNLPGSKQVLAKRQDLTGQISGSDHLESLLFSSTVSVRSSTLGLPSCPYSYHTNYYV